MDFLNYYNSKKNLIDKLLKELFMAEGDAPVIYEAMAYSVLAGGKRLRPVLSIMSCELFDGELAEVLPFSCALELIHTYSLIHDDLPAMDNDDFRRGKLTNHKVFGDGFAVLAGDALLNKAYEILLDNIFNSNKKEYKKAALIISKAAGTMGMIGGQAMDLFYEKKDISIDNLYLLHDRKTGALIKASLEAGAVIACADQKDLEIISKLGFYLGRAFQITDDILDVKGDTKKLGKTIGKDYKSNKMTFVRLFGLEKSEELAKDMIKKAKDLLLAYGDKGKYLTELADYIVERDY